MIANYWRAALAGVLFAGVMTLLSANQGEPWLGSYVFGFLAYALVFAVPFGIVMRAIERR